MNAFEDIVKLFLENKEKPRYWVRQSVKLSISPSDKRRIGLPTMNRPEIDIVAFSAKENKLLLVEVKSFFYSRGVRSANLINPKHKRASRYRLFTQNKFRSIVTKAVRKEFRENGLINKQTEIGYALAVGKFASAKDWEEIQKHFAKKKWELFCPENITKTIKILAKNGWEDNPIVLTAEML